MRRGTPVDRRAALRRGGAALAALAGVSTAGCAAGGASGPRTVEMTAALDFDPETATVPVGGTVRWTNGSDVPHTVTAYGDSIPDGAAYFASGGFDSERAARNDVRGGLIDPGGAYEHAFSTAGTYEYFCIPHEGSGMVGRVRVG